MKLSPLVSRLTSLPASALPLLAGVRPACGRANCAVLHVETFGWLS